MLGHVRAWDVPDDTGEMPAEQHENFLSTLSTGAEYGYRINLLNHLRTENALPCTEYCSAFRAHISPRTPVLHAYPRLRTLRKPPFHGCTLNRRCRRLGRTLSMRCSVIGSRVSRIENCSLRRVITHGDGIQKGGPRIGLGR